MLISTEALWDHLRCRLSVTFPWSDSPPNKGHLGTAPGETTSHHVPRSGNQDTLHCYRLPLGDWQGQGQWGGATLSNAKRLPLLCSTAA